MKRHLMWPVFTLVFVSSLGAEERFHYPAAKHGTGELKYVNHVPVFIAGGTPEQIGDAYGELVAKPASRILKTMPEFVKSMGLSKLYPMIVKSGDVLIKRLPQAYRQELDAAAKSSGLGRELFVFGNAMPDFYKLSGCSTIIVEADRSKTGAPIFGRNFDWPPYRDMPAYSVVTVIKAEGKHTFASIGIPPILGVFSGINDAGLALTMNEIFFCADGSPRLESEGALRLYCFRRILEECSTVDEAEKLMRTFKPTTTASITVCDPNDGAVFELSPKNLKVRKAINDVCLCTNHFRCEGLVINRQCWRYKELLPTQEANGKLDVKDVWARLDAVNQNAWTMQSMVFQPREMKLHLAIATDGSATKEPVRTLDLKELFGGGQK